MKLFLLLICIPLGTSAYSQPVSDCLWSPDRSVLQYDDGTAAWTSASAVKGVWFSLSDFSPYATDFYCDQLEFWMFEPMASGWWESEIWTGGPEGPDSQLVATTTWGYSMQPAFAVFNPPIQCGVTFWVVMDCWPMGSGRPYALADGTPNLISHSYKSENWEVWEPFTHGDFFFRAHGTLQLDLEESSWGAIKTLFY